MQCYHFLAATIAVAKTVDSMPGTEHQLPYGVIANWMVENDIDTDELLLQLDKGYRLPMALAIRHTAGPNKAGDQCSCKADIDASPINVSDYNKASEKPIHKTNSAVLSWSR